MTIPPIITKLAPIVIAAIIGGVGGGVTSNQLQPSQPVQGTAKCELVIPAETAKLLADKCKHSLDVLVNGAEVRK